MLLGGLWIKEVIDSDSLEIFVLFPYVLAFKCNNDIYWDTLSYKDYSFEKEVDREIIGYEFNRKCF